MKSIKITTLIVLSISAIICQVPDSHYDSQEDKQIAQPHGRLHIYNTPSPKTEREDKSKDPDSLSAKFMNIVQTCSKRDKKRAFIEKKKYDYEGDKNAIAFRQLPSYDDQDKVMELSFHFGQEVADHFLNKFQPYYALLTQPDSKDYVPQKLEIVY